MLHPPGPTLANNPKLIQHCISVTNTMHSNVMCDDPGCAHRLCESFVFTKLNSIIIIFAIGAPDYIADCVFESRFVNQGL